MELAAGMGVSRDYEDLERNDLKNVPVFHVMGGFGAGILGVNFAFSSTQALGRSRSPFLVDRLAGEALLVFRPAAVVAPWRDSAHYLARVARAFSAAVGPAYEHVSASRPRGGRFGVRVGGHIDLPLSPAREPSELRLRVGVRRFLGFDRAVLTTGANDPCRPAQSCRRVGDTQLEVLGALAVVF